MDTEQANQELPTPEPGSYFGLVCPECKYNLDGLPKVGSCPECSTEYDKAVLTTNLHLKRSRPSMILLTIPPAVMAILTTLLIYAGGNDPYAFFGVILFGILPASLLSCIVAPIELAVAFRPEPMNARKRSGKLKAAAAVLLVINCLMAAAFVIAFGTCLIALTSP